MNNDVRVKRAIEVAIRKIWQYMGELDDVE